MMMSQMQILRLLQHLSVSQLPFPKMPSLVAEVDLLGWEEPNEKKVLQEEVEEILWNVVMSWV